MRSGIPILFYYCHLSSIYTSAANAGLFAFAAGVCQQMNGVDASMMPSWNCEYHRSWRLWGIYYRQENHLCTTTGKYLRWAYLSFHPIFPFSCIEELMKVYYPVMFVKVIHHLVECALLYLMLSRRPSPLLLSFNHSIEIVKEFSVVPSCDFDAPQNMSRISWVTGKRTVFLTIFSAQDPDACD